MLTKQRLNIILGSTDLWALSVIIDYTGNESKSAIVRELLRKRAREIRREQAQAQRNAKEDGTWSHGY